MRQLRWGIQTSPHHVSYGELLQVWQRIDALGYDSAWLFDHFQPISGDSTGRCFEGWTLLAALLAQTERLHGGLLVTSSIYRNAGLLAKMGATVDILSGGRLEMGLGAGWFEGEAQAFGIPFPSTGERLAILDETAQVIRQLWTQETTTYHGKHVHFTDARCNPKPLQQPTPPIWIGGQGEKVTLRIVAQFADGWDMDMAALATYRHKLNVLQDHCSHHRRDIREIRKMIHFPAVIAETDSEAMRRAQALAREWNTTTDELRERVLIGTPAQAAEQLWPYVELGAEQFVMSIQAPYDPRMVELFIQEVKPRVERLAYVD